MSSSASSLLSRRTLALLAASGLCGVAALYFLLIVPAQGPAAEQSEPVPLLVRQLQPGTVARMDSPLFVWSPGWSVTGAGADPAEPQAPELTPSGTLTFTYSGSELALLAAVGDYWGYLYVSVDGQPANLLPDSRGHLPERAGLDGYKPLYAPELQQAGAPAAQWVRVHRTHDENETDTHVARIEVWRAWGQTPLRAVAVAALPALAPPRWPAVALLAAAFWLAWPLWRRLGARAVSRAQRLTRFMRGTATLLAQARTQRAAAATATAGLALVVLGVAQGDWLFCAPGVLLLGLAAIVRPALWYAALLFGLPFYFRLALPLLPNRALNLVDSGVLLGLGAVLVHALISAGTETPAMPRVRFARAPWIVLALLATWALVSVAGAQQQAVALREWRTVFVAALALGLGLLGTLHLSRAPRADVALLVGGWLLGAAVMSAAALLLYPAAGVIIPAEGVSRLRAFYGSPNNLALYLDRTLAVTLAAALFLRDGRLRLLAWLLALPQIAAFVLTYSKGGLFLGLPAAVLVLFVGGMWLLRRQQPSTRPLWLLAGVALLVTVGLIPALGAERFQRIFDLAAGTGFLRVNLWRAALQMAQDYALTGVGPDNFLYAYRSSYLLPQAWMEPNLNHPHTWLLDWWTRLGLPGLLLGLTWWGSIVGLGVRRLRAGQEPALLLGVLAAAAAALSHGLIDASYALPDLMVVWALMTVLVSLESPQSPLPA